MRLPTSRAALVAAVAAGAVSGTLVSIGLGELRAGSIERPTPRQDGGSRPMAPRPQPSWLPPPPVATGAVREDLSRMEQRISRLETASSTGDDAQPQAGAPPASLYHERHEQAIRQHEAEPIDSAWGPQTTNLVRADIERLQAAGGFHALAVECRTATCAAVVQWPSREAASEGHRWLLQFPLRANCDRTIVIPDPTGGGEARATLLLDCNSWRADGAHPIPEELIPPLPI